MTEKQFIKNLKSKNNNNGMFTYLEIVKLFEKPPKNRLTKMINKISNKFKSPEEIIRDNFNLIFENLSDEYINAVVNFLLEHQETKVILEEKIETVLKKINSSEYEHEALLKEFDKSSILEKKLDFILKNDFNMRVLFYVAKLLKGKNELNDIKINEKIKQRKIELAKLMLNKRLEHEDGLYEVPFKEKDIDDFAITLSLIIDELLESENARYIDITKLSSGGYSDVYLIRNKVLKVSEDRETYDMPNHRRILQPLTRTRPIVNEEKNLSIGCIEVEEKVTSLDRRERSKEKLYSIYKELRDENIVWTDARFENIGKLIKENIPTLGENKMYVSPNSLGFDRSLNKDEDYLKAGDWIILDTDFIYKNQQKNKEWSRYSYSMEFEERYLKEKKEGSKQDKKEKNKPNKNEIVLE